MNLLNNDDGSTRDAAALMKMEVASVTYQFKVEYAKSKNMIPDGDFITSPIFKLHDHDCKIHYFPPAPGSREFIGLTLAMNSKSVRVTASFTFGLLDKYGHPSTEACKSVAMNEFYPFSWDYCDIPHFMKQSELEAHYVRDDGCFTLVCTIRILNNSYKEMPKRFVNGIMPFSIDEHFLQLYLNRQETADVRFEVEGEIFTAHRLVLVTRSLVFKERFFGQTAESKTKIITIKGMKPAVFKAMLHFIYTDSLPDMSHENENIPIFTMTRHLLVAAYRYGLDGLKMLCEDSLVRGLSVDTVISTLALANDLRLDDLEDRCICFVCQEENLVKLSVTDEYLQLMVRRPLLFHEIKCLANFLSSLN